MALLNEVPFNGQHPDALFLMERLNAWQPDKAVVRNLAQASAIPLADVDWDGEVRLVWPRVLDVAAKLGQLRALVERVAQAVPAEDLFQRLLRESEVPDPTRRPSAAELFETALLWNHVPMIDRQDLRESLRMMAGPGGRRALLVIGGKASGKSHTRLFINYLAENGQAGKVRPIDNSRRAGTPIDVRELTQVIGMSLLRKPAPDFDSTAQPDTIINLFRGWLVGHLEEIETPMWLVFDGFSNKSATAAALRLVQELAQAAADHELGLLRVVVLGYGGKRAMVPQALFEPLGRPTESDVKAFFTKVATTVQRQSPDPAAVEMLFADFVAKGGPVETRPISELGPSALERALEVFGGPR
jgi:hypothetical protein